MSENMKLTGSITGTALATTFVSGAASFLGIDPYTRSGLLALIAFLLFIFEERRWIGIAVLCASALQSLSLFITGAYIRRIKCSDPVFMVAEHITDNVARSDEYQGAKWFNVDGFATRLTMTGDKPYIVKPPDGCYIDIDEQAVWHSVPGLGYFVMNNLSKKFYLEDCEREHKNENPRWLQCFNAAKEYYDNNPMKHPEGYVN